MRQGFTMIMVIRILCVLLCLGTTLVADTEFVREAQEELRKRNLFFGDIDGQITPQLTNALKRYQTRKGFEVTGAIDSPTAASLQIQSLAGSPSAGSEMARAPKPSNIPANPAAATAQVATVSSTTAVYAAEGANATQAASTTEAAAELVARAQGEAAWADLPVVPEPPAEAPTPDLITADRVNRFVETYLADGETDDIGLQVWFYRFPVKYFSHGLVNQDFVVKDTQAYVKRWPERNYRIVAPITFNTSGPEGETQIEFTIDYTVRNKGRTKSGRTKNFWTVRASGDDMKIIAIREEHIRG